MRWFSKAATASVLSVFSLFAVGQDTGTAKPMTADEDHQNMMDQLGIRVLRPGPSGDEKAPNHANYDEALANPYPNLPDPLTLRDGKKVTSAKMWWDERRPQLVAMFEDEVYGHVPANVPHVTWTVRTVDHERVGFNPVIAKDLIGVVDNSADPAIKVNLHMTLVLPANATGPVPVLMMFGRAGFPYPAEPNAEQMEKVNDAWKALLMSQDPSLKQVFAEHPAWQPVKETPFTMPQLNEDGGLPNTWQLIAAGWGYAMFDPTSAQADNGAGVERGNHWAGESWQAAHAGTVGCAARVGVGCRAWVGLSGDRPSRRCKACGS